MSTQEPLRSRLCRYQGISVQLQGGSCIGCGHDILCFKLLFWDKGNKNNEKRDDSYDF